MFGIKKNKDLYSWMEEKLGKEFKYEATLSSNYDSAIDTEQLALWYLHYLKEESKTNEEIKVIFCEIFKKISKNLPNKSVYAWFGFDPNKFSPFSFFYAIVKDVHEREYHNLVKRDSLLNYFVQLGRDNSKNPIPFKKNNPTDLGVIIKHPELNAKHFTSRHKIFEPENDLMIKELENYSKFKEVIRKIKKQALNVVQEDVVISRALLFYDEKSHPLEVFKRAFGEDKEFKAKYYEIFRKHYVLSPHFLKMKQHSYQYTYDPSKNYETNRFEMLSKFQSAIMEAMEKMNGEED